MGYSDQTGPVPSAGRLDYTPFPSADPQRVIVRALGDARRRGLDDVSQFRCAVAAVLVVRPDMSASDAARSVEHVKGQC